MFGESETRCIENIVNFIKRNPQFRSITLRDEGNLMQQIDPCRTFLMVKGSYKAQDILISILLNHGITSPDKTSSGVSLMYKLQCETGLDVVFTREFHYDLAAKRIGPKPEIEVDDKEIDDAFIIHTEDTKKTKKLLLTETFRKFLLNSKNNLEKFEIKPEYIEYQRSVFNPENETEELEQDIENLVAIISSISTEGEYFCDIGQE
jgi:hypothetical protein